MATFINRFYKLKTSLCIRDYKIYNFFNWTKRTEKL